MGPNVLIDLDFAFAVSRIDLQQHLTVVFVIYGLCIVDQIGNWVLTNDCVDLFLAYELVISILLLVYVYLFLL